MSTSMLVKQIDIEGVEGDAEFEVARDDRREGRRARRASAAATRLASVRVIGPPSRARSA
ncbi:MAG: hypothetical protein KJZ54_10415 [Phycisphaerales bacterium]|nr:hypothetical protein [Phycisphaerales bacterium]